MFVGNKPFYHEHIKTATRVFGTLFNNLYIERNQNGTVVQQLKVPLHYVNKDRSIYRLRQDPEFGASVQMLLPRMGFSLVGLSYAPERKTNPMNIRRIDKTANTATIDYVDVPYDLNFELDIAVKYTEDGARIIEQILPYFNPEYTVTINDIPSLGLKRDIQIRLDSVSVSESLEGELSENTFIEWNLSFTMKMFFHPNITDKKIITASQVQLFEVTPDENVLAATISAT